MVKSRTVLLSIAVFLILNVSAWSQVVLIVHPGVKSISASKAEVREVFTGESTSLKDGSRVIPVLLRPGPIEDEFVATFVGKSDSAFRAAWRSLIFSGQAGMPRTLDSEKAVIDYITRTPGTIGFISRKTPHEGVRILDVR